MITCTPDTINERFLKLRSQRSKADRITVSRDFQMDEEVEIKIRGQIVEIKQISTDSDLVDIEYVLKGEIDI